jgi:hypothetical protein
MWSRSILEGVCEAFNAHDLDAVMAYFADDCESFQDDTLVATQLEASKVCVVRPIEVRGEQHSARLRKWQPVWPRAEVERNQQPAACMAPHIGEDIAVGRESLPVPHRQLWPLPSQLDQAPVEHKH